MNFQRLCADYGKICKFATIMSKTPYRRGAEDGLKLGIYLTAMTFASIYSDVVPLFGMATFLMAIAVPIIVYRFMVGYKKELGGVVTFSMLWMQGLVLFACASTIAGVMLMMYLRWINPDFLHSQIEALAAMDTSGTFESLQRSKELAQNMLEQNFVPRAIDMVIQYILLGITSGSILSMFLSGIIILRLKYKENKILNSDR